MAEQNIEFFIKKLWNSPNWFCSILEVNATTFDLYFHGCDSDYRHGHKENLKDTLKKNVKIMTNKMRI